MDRESCGRDHQNLIHCPVVLMGSSYMRMRHSTSELCYLCGFVSVVLKVYSQVDSGIEGVGIE